MKRTKLRTRWEPGAKLATRVPLRIVQSTRLEQLKERLLRQQLTQSDQHPELGPVFRRAAQDAASLAWLTPYPLLFLPLLFEEKTEEARQRAERQRSMLQKAAGRKVLV